MGGQSLRIEWSKGAGRNLDAIETYIAKENPLAAAKIVLKIVRRVSEHLSLYPSSGRIGRIDNTRELIFPEFPYIVIYTIKQETIFIVRVFHAAQDLESIHEETF
jgi:toxin ParE1/3/4